MSGWKRKEKTKMEEKVNVKMLNLIKKELTTQ
jgi:hypothetical protein